MFLFALLGTLHNVNIFLFLEKRQRGRNDRVRGGMKVSRCFWHILSGCAREHHHSSAHVSLNKRREREKGTTWMIFHFIAMHKQTKANRIFLLSELTAYTGSAVAATVCESFPRFKASYMLVKRIWRIFNDVI